MSTAATIESLFQEDLYLLPPRTLVVVEKEWHTYSEAEQLLLSKILGSVKLTLASVQLVTRATFTTDSVAPLNPKQIIAFGATSGSLKKYESTQLDGVSVVLADGLDQLDDARKKNLWTALKQMFTI
jgi:hypothetical protein